MQKQLVLSHAQECLQVDPGTERMNTEQTSSSQSLPRRYPLIWRHLKLDTA